MSATVETALAEAHQRYTARNPKSFARYREACEVMPGGNTRTVLFHSPFPLGVARGEGCFLFDLDHHRYTDFLGEYTAGIYGHSHPVIRAAIDRALDAGINLGAHNLLEARLARAICDRFPSLELVRFTNSGTEANLMAISASCVYTERRKVMVFDGGYHGGVFAFANGGNPINAPYEFVIAPYNNSAGTKALFEQHGDQLAAIVVEPMLGSGGCIPADREFLQLLRDAATRHGCVLIFDEVMTSRLAPGGLQAEHGVLPDLTTLGKYIGGGMSFGGFGGRAAIMGMFDPRRPDALPHAGTFNNNVLTMAAGLAGLTEVYTPEACRTLNTRGDALREQLNDLCHRHEVPMQFSGRGSMMTAHMTGEAIRSPQDAARGNQKLKELFFFDMLERGLWLAQRGMINLSLPLGDAEHEQLLSAVEGFLVERGELLDAIGDRR